MQHPGHGLYSPTCALPLLQTCREPRNENENGTKVRRKHSYVLIYYRRAGEVEATPVLPSDEVDRLASLSAGLSTSGGVLGTRSGFPDCMPRNRTPIKIEAFDARIFKLMGPRSVTVVWI